MEENKKSTNFFKNVFSSKKLRIIFIVALVFLFSAVLFMSMFWASLSYSSNAGKYFRSRLDYYIGAPIIIVFYILNFYFTKYYFETNEKTSLTTALFLLFDLIFSAFLFVPIFMNYNLLEYDLEGFAIFCVYVNLVLMIINLIPKIKLCCTAFKNNLEKNNEKKLNKKNVGILLIGLQILGYIGFLIGGGYFNDVFSFIGFNIPLIIGVVLIILYYKNKNKTQNIESTIVKSAVDNLIAFYKDFFSLFGAYPTTEEIINITTLDAMGEKTKQGEAILSLIPDTPPSIDLFIGETKKRLQVLSQLITVNELSIIVLSDIYKLLNKTTQPNIKYYMNMQKSFSKDLILEDFRFNYDFFAFMLLCDYLEEYKEQYEVNDSVTALEEYAKNRGYFVR